MTDFLRIDLTVALTCGGHFHSIGFDVLIEDWPDMERELIARDPNMTLEFREEEGPRNVQLGEKYRWIWVVMLAGTPLSVVLYLAECSNRLVPDIHFRPNEFP